MGDNIFQFIYLFCISYLDDRVILGGVGQFFNLSCFGPLLLPALYNPTSPSDKGTYVNADIVFSFYGFSRHPGWRRMGIVRGLRNPVLPRCKLINETT